MAQDPGPNTTSKPMDIEAELYKLTGDTIHPIKVRNRLLAAKLIAQNVLTSESEDVVLAVFDQLRVAAELVEPFGGFGEELH